MNYKSLIASAMTFALLTSAVGCDDKNEESSSSSMPESSTAEISETDAVSEETEPTEELIPPTPVEATDENSVTFDDDNFSFASVVDDEGASQGELSVVEVQGNKMLKFTDLSDSMEEEQLNLLVLKILIRYIELSLTFMLMRLLTSL